MFSPARIIAIDDKEDHLTAIADALNLHGEACLRLLFNGGIGAHKFRAVRVIFMDVHLSDTGASADDTKHFSLIGSLLVDHVDTANGPFILILWTEFPDRAKKLSEFLFTRLLDHPHAIPVAVAALDKAHHLAGKKIVDPLKLIAEIDRALKKNPQVKALVSWEERIADSAAQTLTGLLELVPPDKRHGELLTAELSRLLNALATAAVGSANVGKDRLAAVNEALLPLLYDNVARIGSTSKGRQDPKVWKAAIPRPGDQAAITEDEAARLNAMLHFDFKTTACGACDRGVVILVRENWDMADTFKQQFGMRPLELARWQYGVNVGESTNACTWVFVQVEGICDYAQAHDGLNPYVLALECPAELSSPMRTKPDAVWDSPVFMSSGDTRRTLVANFRYTKSFTDAQAKELTVKYRLREALINDLAARMHSYGARPGIVRFDATLPVAPPVAEPESVDSRPAAGAVPQPESLVAAGEPAGAEVRSTSQEETSTEAAPTHGEARSEQTVHASTAADDVKQGAHSSPAGDQVPLQAELQSDAEGRIKGE